MGAPATPFTWDTAQTNVLAPTSGQLLNGYATDDVPPASLHNYKFNLIGQWIGFLQSGPTNALLAMQLENWRLASIAAGSVLYAAAFDGTNYTLVGSNSGPNIISYQSNDLLTWTAGTAGGASHLQQVIWDPTNAKYIATDAGGDPFYSAAGLVWSSGTGTTGSGGFAVSSGGVTLALDGATGAVYKSTNATAWTTVTSLPHGNGNCICFGAPSATFTYVAGCTDTTNQIAYSTNSGSTWTAAAFPGSPGTSCVGVCFISAQSLFYALDSGGNVYTSPTGATWTKISGAAPSGVLGGHSTNGPSPLMGDANQLVIVQNSSATGKIYQSFDAGVTWTARFGSRLDAACQALFFDTVNGVFLDCRKDTKLGVTLVLTGA